MPKPQALIPDPDMIPRALKERRQWIAWRPGKRGGKWTKIPVDARTGNEASSTDPNTWATFEDALAYYQTGKADGIGYVFSEDDPYVGIDLDKCCDPKTGAVESWAKEVIDRLGSYTELSPSGKGIHIIVEGKLPPGRRRKGPIEMYEQGRYFTITGHADGDIQEKSDELAAWHSEVFAEEQSESRKAERPPQPVDLSDSELIAKAQSGKGGDKFSRLWNGDLSDHGSHSEADLALCNMLAFWTGRDAHRMDALFRQSGLMREKWERSDYRERTIEEAVSSCTDVYSPPAPSTVSKPKATDNTVELITGLKELAANGPPSNTIRWALEEPETIHALAMTAKDQRATVEAILLDLRSRGASVREVESLEKAINAEKKKLRHLHVVDESKSNEIELKKVQDCIDDAPVSRRAVVPDGWIVNSGGVFKVVVHMDGEGNVQSKEIRNISRCPIVITGRVHNQNDSREWSTLAWFRDGKWHRTTCARETIATSREICGLAAFGLPVNSLNAGDVIGYLSDYEAENLSCLPPRLVSTKMGWQGEPGTSEFLPGSESIVPVQIEGGGVKRIRGYTARGEAADWLEAASKARRNPLVRLVIATSLCAPLLSIINHRSFIVHLYGDSRGGKTAAANWAISVWGNPDDLIATFNATKVGLERLAASYSDLPLIVDERQIADDRQGSVEALVYMLGLGKGKVRGTRGGGLQEVASWRMPVITTGEEPLATDSSATGVWTRNLEVFGRPFSDEQEAAAAYGFLPGCHGHAGPMLVNRLKTEISKDPEIVLRDHETARKILHEHRPDSLGSHISALAAIMIADFYATTWLWGIDEKQALAESQELAFGILGQLASVQETDQATRALSWVRTWVHQHYPKFNDDVALSERFGWFRYDYAYILPSAFKKCMDEGGFSERRVLRDFADRGWIETSIEGGKTNYKTRTTEHLQGARHRVVMIRPGAISESDAV